MEKIAVNMSTDANASVFLDKKIACSSNYAILTSLSELCFALIQ